MSTTGSWQRCRHWTTGYGPLLLTHLVGSHLPLVLCLFLFAANSGNQVTGMAKMMFWVSHHSYQPWFPADDYSYPTYLCAAPWPDSRQPHPLEVIPVVSACQASLMAGFVDSRTASSLPLAAQKRNRVLLTGLLGTTKDLRGLPHGLTMAHGIFCSYKNLHRRCGFAIQLHLSSPLWIAFQSPACRMAVGVCYQSSGSTSAWSCLSDTGSNNQNANVKIQLSSLEPSFVQSRTVSASESRGNPSPFNSSVRLFNHYSHRMDEVLTSAACVRSHPRVSTEPEPEPKAKGQPLRGSIGREMGWSRPWKAPLRR